MTKRLLIAIAMLCVAGSGWGANETYYVSPSGSNTSPYDTWAKAATALNTTIALAHGDGNATDTDTIYVAPGTYTEGFTTLGSGATNLRLYGTAAHGSTAPAALDQVIMSGTAAYAWRNDGANNVTVKYITIKGGTAGSAAFLLNGPTGFTFSNGAIKNSGGTCFRAIGGATGLTFTNNFVGGCGVAYGLSIEGTAAGTVAYNIISPTDNTNMGGAGLSLPSSGTVNVYNNVVVGYTAYGIGVDGATANISNNYIGSPYTVNNYNVTRSSGTANLSYNLMSTNWDKSIATNGTLADNTGNITTASPRYKTPKRGGYIVVAADDSGPLIFGGTHWTWLTTLEESLQSRGMKGTWYTNGMYGASYPTELKGISDRGTMTIGDHGWSHFSLGLTGTAFTITKASDNVNIIRADDNIVLGSGSTVTGFKAKTLGAIRDELTVLGCTVGTMVSGGQWNARGEVLADSDGAQSTASGYAVQLLIDNTAAIGLYKSEMADSKTALGTAINGTVATLGTPSNSASANVKAAAIAIGYAGMRYSTYDNTDTNRLISSYDIYKGAAIPVSYFLGSDNAVATIQQNGRIVGQYLAEVGGIWYIYTHSSTGAGGNEDMTNAQWNTLLDTFAGIPGLVVTSADDAITRIKSAGTTSDNVTYTRTWTGAADYSLLSSSPAINAGVDVGLTMDYRGMTVPQGSAPDIGAYEFGPGDPGFLKGTYRGTMGIHWMW